MRHANMPATAPKISLTQRACVAVGRLSLTFTTQSRYQTSAPSSAADGNSDTGMLMSKASSWRTRPQRVH
eukprot:6180467-Pleurochrysis_carterae.AAC.2